MDSPPRSSTLLQDRHTIDQLRTWTRRIRKPTRHGYKNKSYLCYVGSTVRRTGFPSIFSRLLRHLEKYVPVSLASTYAPRIPLPIIWLISRSPTDSMLATGVQPQATRDTCTEKQYLISHGHESGCMTAQAIGCAHRNWLVSGSKSAATQLLKDVGLPARLYAWPVDGRAAALTANAQGALGRLIIASRKAYRRQQGT